MYGVDRLIAFDYPRREIGIIGWCCHDDRTVAEEVWAECGGARTPCLWGLSRPDIARAFDSPDLERSGFMCRVPVPRANAQVTIKAGLGDREAIVGEFPVDWSAAERLPAGSKPYAEWLATYEPRLFWPAAEVEQRIARLPLKPRLSIILPTFNTSLYHLQRCIDSVTSQHYPHWELCVTDDASSDARVRPYLHERAAADPRITVTLASERRGISAASNLSLAAATGEMIVLLDHDDELHPAALVEVARALNTSPGLSLVYSDEDKIDQIGVRSQPAFKPAFDEDMLCAFDYLGHLVAIRASVAREVGGFRSECDGAQDWDLILRVTRAIARDQVRHIAKPLYHWRMHEESTAFSLNAKPYAVRAWNRVLSEHLDVAQTCTADEGLFLGSMRVKRRVPQDTRVSIVCRACDGPHQRRALNKTRHPGGARFFELLFASVHPAEAPATSPLSTWHELESDVTVVVSCGIESVNHHFLDELVAQAARADCGIVGATIVSGAGAILTAGLVALSDGTHVNAFEGLGLHDLGYMGQAKVVRRVPSISAHAFAFRTARLEEVRGLAAFSEDTLGELCAALVRSAHASGLHVLHTPYAIATLRSVAASYKPAQIGTAPGPLVLNPNLEAFVDVTAILRGGIL